MTTAAQKNLNFLRDLRMDQKGLGRTYFEGTEGGLTVERKRAIEEEIQDKWGNGAAIGFNILSSIYNLSTERADLRSWQTLPAYIRIARLLLDPGEYEFFLQTFSSDGHRLNKISLGKSTVEAGEKKFFLFRNYR